MSLENSPPSNFSPEMYLVVRRWSIPWRIMANYQQFLAGR